MGTRTQESPFISSVMILQPGGQGEPGALPKVTWLPRGDPWAGGEEH